MVDKVKPLKIETSVDGSQDDVYPVELDPTEDYVSTRGIAFTNSDNHRIDTLDNEIQFIDPINGTMKLSTLLNKGRHEILDTLTHTIAENSYLEVTRSGGKIQSQIWWNSIAKTTKIREILYTRSLGKLSLVVSKQYDASGVLLVTYTETIGRTDGKVSTVTGVVS